MFIGLFTNLRLWDLMNVNYPKDSPYLLAFGTGTILLGLALSLLSLRLKGISKEEIARNLIIPFLMVGIGFASTM
jgi:hypothetical protein